MRINDNDLWTLSFYRESELAGGLVLGRVARETEDDELRVRLTEHAAEEVRHAWLWTKCILDLGGMPKRVRRTYQSWYYEELGQPTSVLEVLALTQVFERRVMRHFRAHLTRETNPVIAATLRQLIEDEIGHVSWVKDWLDAYGSRYGHARVAATLARFTDADRRIYAHLSQWFDRPGELLAADGDEPVRGNVTAEMRAIVTRSTGIRPEIIRADSTLRDLGVDSLDLAMLVMSLEETFKIEFTPSDIEELETFADLVARVRRLRNAA